MKSLKILTLLCGISMMSFTAQSTTPSMENSSTISDESFNDSLNSVESLSFESLAFPATEYFAEKTVKVQHCLHHTASGKGISGDYKTFLNPGKIATNVIVGHDKIYKLFSTDHWGYHLGIPKEFFAKMKVPYQRLDKICIGTEIDSWGPLKLIDGKFVAYVNNYGSGDTLDKKGNRIKVIVPENEVVHYPNKFRGYEYYQAYNPFQINAVKLLCNHYKLTHGIPTTYREEMWDVDVAALKGTPGTFTHVSYRIDKSDCHPQPELIEALKSIS